MPVVFLIFSLGIALGSVNSAKAVSFLNYGVFTGDINKSTYSPGEAIEFTGSAGIYVSADNCVHVIETAVINNITYTAINKEDWCDSIDILEGKIIGNRLYGNTTGSAPVTPGNYKVKVTGKVRFSNSNSWDSASANIPYTVTASPPTCSAYWSPSGPITTGGSSTIYWSSSANATSATYSCSGPIPGSGSLGISGSLPVTFLSAGTENCTINVSGPGGSGSCNAILVVNPPACTPSCGAWGACSAACGGGWQTQACTGWDCSTYNNNQQCNMQACACAPNNPGCAANTCIGNFCWDGCANIPGTKVCACVPNNPGCAANTCIGNSCWDGCAWQNGTKVCACVPNNPGCAANTCIGNLCWNGCANIPGTKPCCVAGCTDEPTACSASCGGGTKTCIWQDAECNINNISLPCNTQACPTTSDSPNWREITP